MGTTKTWTVHIYTGPCEHNGKKNDAPTKPIYGTQYCPVCKSSRGADDLWRALQER